MNNNTCDHCDGSGVGSGGYNGTCGYCDATGEGTCSSCGYPATMRNPPSMCDDHGVSPEGRELGRENRADALAGLL